MSESAIGRAYDEKYRTTNFFKDRVWLYRPFVKAIVAKAQLEPGQRLLDAGCGQGFFTNLFAECGLNAVGVDISEVGIKSAARDYPSARTSFKTGDICRLNCQQEFDCVFTRSCSLYNSLGFKGERVVTDLLLSYVRPGGLLIFDYYTRMNPARRSNEWIYHSLNDVSDHFSRYPGTEVFFSLRVDSLLMGRLSLTRAVSRISAYASSRTSLGGELLAFVRKERVPKDRTGL